MCQIVSDNQGGDVDDLPITSLPIRRLPRRPNFVIGSSKDISALSGDEQNLFPDRPQEPTRFTHLLRRRRPSSSSFQRPAAKMRSILASSAPNSSRRRPVPANKSRKTENAEVTLENVFKYVTGLINSLLDFNKIN
jgi:hypothetical protein